MVRNDSGDELSAAERLQGRSDDAVCASHSGDLVADAAFVDGDQGATEIRVTIGYPQGNGCLAVGAGREKKGGERPGPGPAARRSIGGAKAHGCLDW